MKTIRILSAITVLLSFMACNAHIKNAKTESVKIYGNCEMCETTIEEAGNLKKVAEVDWNTETQMATLIYDTSRTNRNEILKRIALVGYDNDQFLAPDDVYAKLPECCQARLKNSEEVEGIVADDHSQHNYNGTTDNHPEVIPETDQLNVVYVSYFLLKDALVKSDGNEASVKANELLFALNAVLMNELSAEEHTVWMKVMYELKRDAGHIAETIDVVVQRGYFSTLSDNLYQLLKISELEFPIYYQHCPMANDGKGGNWLSKENAIENPYYGSAMLTCGETREKIE